MPDSTIGVELVKLKAGMFGPPQRFNWIPDDGFVGTAGGNNNVAAQYPVGTVVQCFQDGTTGQPGTFEMAYLQSGTQNASNATAAGDLCTLDSATKMESVSNDPDTALSVEGGIPAVALGATTNAYYSWFWVGGVCPEDTIFFNGSTSPLTTAGDLVTDGTATAGWNIMSDCSADVIGIGAGGASDAEEACFFLLAADA